MLKRPKRLPGDPTEKQLIDRIIRVNQAGEYGARRIYKGQLSVLNDNSEILEMYEQEKEHLDYFNAQVPKYGARPTLFSIPWHVLGFTLGFITAKFGKESAMACTVAVEEVIGEHYNSQLQELQKYNNHDELKKNIAKFRDDELEHRDTACNEGAKDAKGYTILHKAIGVVSKFAIKISKVL